MSGTVNISRGIWSDTAFKDQPFTEREAFMWMVMEASWKPREKRVGSVVVNLERGQLASSIRFMADAWNWQKSTVDRFLKRLENRDMIGTASGTGVTVVTICKYNDYQNAPSDSGTPKNTNAGQQRDSSGTNENKGLIPEERREEDTDVSLSVSPDAIHANELSEAVAIYNTAAQHAGWPKVQKMTPQRSRSLRARIKDCGGLEGWRAALRRAYASDFCREGWRGFNLDSLISQQKFTNLMEGRYDNRTDNRTGASGSPRKGGDRIFDEIALAAGLGQAQSSGGF